MPGHQFAGVLMLQILQMKRVLYLINVVVVVVPLLVLVGWQFDVEFLKRPIPASVVMNPVTAVCILFSGFAFYLLSEQSRKSTYLLTARVLATLVLIIGLLKLSAVFTGINIGIDTVLYRQRLLADHSDSNPNTMAPNAAFAFVFYACALLLLSWSGWRRLKFANYLAVLVLMVSLFSIIGYLYHVKVYYGLPSFYPMAIHTAFSFLLLSLLMLLYNNKVGFMVILSSPNIAGQVARLLIPATIIVPITLGFIRLYAQWHVPISVELGVSLLIISVIAVFFSLTWYVSVALNKADEARIHAEEELIRRNETLRIAEERLLLATEGTSAGIWDWEDMNADKEWWSSRFYELLGYANNEIPASAKTFRDIMHPDDFRRIAKRLDAHFKNESRFEIEARLKTKSGAYKWFLGTGQVSRDKHGKPVRMVGSIVDIDEQKRTRDSIEQQAALINLLPDGIVFYAKGMKFADINAGAEKMFGLKREEVVGKNLNEFISFSLPGGEVFENSLAQLWQTGFYRNEIQITNLATGKTVNVLVTIKKMENTYGSEPQFMAIYTDLTPLRVNEELRKALKSVETNNQYLEQFAYISAHDIKAPIITIAGLTELMTKRNAVKDEHKPVLRMLTNSIGQIQRTNNALNNILKLRKNLVDHQHQADQLLTLQTIIDDVKTSLYTEINAAEATLEENLEGLADTNFNAVYLKSIIYNLLSNAIKYRDPLRKLVVKITARRTNDDKFSFIVEDNGLGFDVDRNKTKMFGIFKRFHTHVEGSGVGLHIVKSIVDEYNGSIDVQSEPGKGTRFVLELNKNILA